MGKKFPWALNLVAGLTPGLAVYFNLRLNLSLCEFARNQGVCREANSWAQNWWQIALAASLGVLAVALGRGSLNAGYRSLRRRFRRHARRAAKHPAVLSSAAAED